MEELVLLSNPNSMASEAMSLAADHRSEGYDPSTALEMAWDEVRGEAEDHVENPSRGSSLIGIALIAVGGWLFWYYRKYSRLPWQQAAPVVIPPADTEDEWATWERYPAPSPYTTQVPGIMTRIKNAIQGTSPRRLQPVRRVVSPTQRSNSNSSNEILGTIWP